MGHGRQGKRGAGKSGKGEGGDCKSAEAEEVGGDGNITLTEKRQVVTCIQRSTELERSETGGGLHRGVAKRRRCWLLFLLVVMLHVWELLW